MSRHGARSLWPQYGVVQEDSPDAQGQFPNPSLNYHVLLVGSHPAVTHISITVLDCLFEERIQKSPIFCKPFFRVWLPDSHNIHWPGGYPHLRFTPWGGHSISLSNYPHKKLLTIILCGLVTQGLKGWVLLGNRSSVQIRSCIRVFFPVAYLFINLYACIGSSISSCGTSQIHKIIKRVTKLHPFMACIFGKCHKRPWRIKGKYSGVYISKTLEIRPGATTSINQMISDQPGIIPQVTGVIIHSRLWAATVFVDHYYDYLHDHIMRGTSAEDTLQIKEAYGYPVAIHSTRFWYHRSGNGIF